MAAPVSVIIPTYNRAACIGRCLRSVAAQTVAPLEVIVVDDGSRDDTLRVVEGLSGEVPGLRSIAKPNGGVASARNLGLEAASGEWIAFLDSDDEWSPVKLENALAAMAERPEAEIVHTNRAKYFEDGGLESVRPFPRADMEDRRFLLATFCVAIQTMLIRRTLIERMDRRFDTGLRTCSDYEFIFRALLESRGVAYLETCDTTIHLTRESIMRSSRALDMLFDDLTAINHALERCRDPVLRESLLHNHRTRATRLLARSLRSLDPSALGRALAAVAGTHNIASVRIVARSLLQALAPGAGA